MVTNKKLSHIVIEILRGRKRNNSLFFVSQSNSKKPKTIRLKCHTLFYNKNTYQKRSSINSTKSFV